MTPTPTHPKAVADAAAFTLPREGDQMIPAEAIEAAAKALFRVSPVSRGAKEWADQPEGGNCKTTFRDDAHVALAAALPYLEHLEES